MRSPISKVFLQGIEYVFNKKGEGLLKEAGGDAKLVVFFRVTFFLESFVGLITIYTLFKKNSPFLFLYMNHKSNSRRICDVGKLVQ